MPTPVMFPSARIFWSVAWTPVGPQRVVGSSTGTAHLMNPTDEQLIALMGHGQEDALRELHRRYAPYLFSMARRMLSGTDDVEACVQDAFVSVWKHAARFDPSRASAKTWLVTIAHRRFLQALRDRPDSTLPLEEWDAPTQSTQPLDRIMLQGALTQLDGEQQKLIELAFYDGYSHGQLAEVTGLPLGTVKTRLRAALSKLRTHLEDKRDA
ncbi:RNA polymerase sigma factor, sigma-70 family [Deinococcus peraridilitoris DSM 19664]|uniref:RNA polymerase sigma factor, sigma-70 family n=2 Tax=Deinococcus TaxID=1298 RepID=K9ZXY1_DEIPD|nr:RNA polymerase sigma factor, sigma-70 family [Deinococcus peraridilitoris DSM 19664]